MIRNFKTLKIWERSRKFVKHTYGITKQFPSEEKFGLVSQLNRASVSVVSNIAEGCGKRTEKDLSRYLDNAIGSACEVETQIYLAGDLGFINEELMKNATDEIQQIRRMIISFQNTLK